MDIRRAADTDGFAIASLVVGVVSIVFFLPLFVLGPVAMYLGHHAKVRIRRSEGGLGGDGLALAGRILGGLSFAIGVFAIAVIWAGMTTHGIGTGRGAVQRIQSQQVSVQP